MSTTERLGLPLLTPGQAQKEFSHNEALLALDTLVAGCVEEGPRNDPPDAPGAGNAYIIGDTPSGAWAGQGGAVAAWTTGGWRFHGPVEGMALTLRGSGLQAHFRGGAWDVGTVRANSLSVEGTKVIGAQAAAIADPAGGTIVDAEARAAIAEVLGALRGHGLIEA